MVLPRQMFVRVMVMNDHSEFEDDVVMILVSGVAGPHSMHVLLYSGLLYCVIGYPMYLSPPPYDDREGHDQPNDYAVRLPSPHPLKTH